MTDFSLASLRDVLKRAIEPAHPYSIQIDRALGLAYKAHDGQFRDQRNPTGPKIPYIAHPVGVAITAVSLLPHVELTDAFIDVMSACLTHDVLEDTKVSLNELEHATSVRAANIVLALTKPSISANKSRAERNAAFIQQIVNAGPTPCFVKICDAIHNLSRPGSMPEDLLSKTIKKAAADYLPLADNVRFQPAVREALTSRIREAELVAQSRERVQKSSEFASFDAAITFGLDKSKSKILEEHDIAAVVEDICNAHHCFIGSIEQYLVLYLDELRFDRGTQSTNSIAIQLKAGNVDLSTRLFDRDNVKARSIVRILSCPFDVTDELAVNRYLFVALSGTSTPGWLTPATLMGLTSILSERLRGREARRLFQLSEELSHLGLALDPGLVQREKLSHEYLVALKSRIEAAEFVYRNLLGSIHRLTNEMGLANYVDRVEGRVKSANSIVEKMRARNFQVIDEIDDFVGIRLIFMSNGIRHRFCELLLKEVRSEITEFARMVPVIASSVELEHVNSSIGYRATHVRFRVKAPTVQFEAVRCEIQMRTVLEDAWARVSQMANYKKDGGSKRIKGVLTEFAGLRDACDDLISKLKI
jgi:ppGpp synthetase/RelA/SpoT-type nucleotidyltranferase